MYQLSFIPWVLFFALASPTSATRQGAGHVTRAIAKETPGLSNVNATFDYVIVGGGTAGLTIASRLAEDPSLSVAVIEAGGYYEADNGNLSVVPGYCTTYTGTNPHLTNPEVDWGFVTTPQAVSTPLKDCPFRLTAHRASGSKQQEPALCSRQDPWRFIRNELYVLPSTDHRIRSKMGIRN